MKPLLARLYLFTALATVIYWVLVFTGAFGMGGFVPWLERFPYVSPLADVWMGGASLLSYVYWKRGSTLAISWGLAGSSAMVFVAITATTYWIVHPVQHVGMAEIVETVVPAYLLVFGGVGFRVLLRSGKEGREAGAGGSLQGGEGQ